MCICVSLLICLDFSCSIAYNRIQKPDICPVWTRSMKRIHQAKRVNEALSKSRYREILEGLPVKLFLIEYEVGELLSAPEDGGHLLQIVVEGALSIY